MKRVFVLVCGLALLAGCSDQGQQDRTIQMLRAAKAKGKMTVAVSQHPLQVGQSTHFFAGPEATITFDGEVDFRSDNEIAALIGKAIAQAQAQDAKLAVPKETY